VPEPTPPWHAATGGWIGQCSNRYHPDVTDGWIEQRSNRYCPGVERTNTHVTAFSLKEKSQTTADLTAGVRWCETEHVLNDNISEKKFTSQSKLANIGTESRRAYVDARADTKNKRPKHASSAMRERKMGPTWSEHGSENIWRSPTTTSQWHSMKNKMKQIV